MRLALLLVISGLVCLLLKAIGSSADRTRWAFDLRVSEAFARTQPCLRTTVSEACPRPLPLAPGYCPFPPGGTP
jgi:hypothetical protein